jgi:hypothetical protein
LMNWLYIGIITNTVIMLKIKLRNSVFLTNFYNTDMH